MGGHHLNEGDVVSRCGCWLQPLQCFSFGGVSVATSGDWCLIWKKQKLEERSSLKVLLGVHRR